jgi:hypothetical protein
MFDVSSVQFPAQYYYNQAGVSFSAYANSLSADARIGLGHVFLNLGSRESNGSPAIEFVNASVQWVGQSLVDGQWASAPPNLSTQAAAADSRKRGEVKDAKPQFTSICRPSCLMMPPNFTVSAATKSENCCGVP